MTTTKNNDNEIGNHKTYSARHYLQVDMPFYTIFFKKKKNFVDKRQVNRRHRIHKALQEITNTRKSDKLLNL